MTEGKQIPNTHTSASNADVASATGPANAQVTVQQKKTFPVLYPSKPHTSSK